MSVLHPKSSTHLCVGHPMCTVVFTSSTHMTSLSTWYVRASDERLFHRRTAPLTTGRTANGDDDEWA